MKKIISSQYLSPDAAIHAAIAESKNSTKPILLVIQQELTIDFPRAVAALTAEADECKNEILAIREGQQEVMRATGPGWLVYMYGEW